MMDKSRVLRYNNGSTGSEYNKVEKNTEQTVLFSVS